MNTTQQEKFVSIRPRDNFYQTASFLPMAFALVTTINEQGETGIGPHALISPFGIVENHSMLLVSRSDSGTAKNIRRRKKCALNYIEFDRKALESVSLLGYPGQSAEEKKKESIFTLVESPIKENREDPDYPKIIDEAFQIYECTLDEDVEIRKRSAPEEEFHEGYFVLSINDILLERDYKDKLDEGQGFPNMPIFYGARDGTAFWFAKHNEPFSIEMPSGKGSGYQAASYLANRLDADIRFTEDACKQLADIPRPFLKKALLGIIGEAKKRDVTLVDEEVLKAINADREK